ncbi:MAG: tetratricopeptide repeat protein [Cyanobacteria bacterium J06623_5]
MLIMQVLWQFIQTNWQILQGIGTVVSTVSKWLWRYSTRRRRRLLSSGGNSFPFEVIRPYRNDVLPRLFRDTQAGNYVHSKHLADFLIPYQSRCSNRDITSELEDALEETGRLLIKGSAGMGKTREAAELAKLFNDKGWTILKYKEGEWLDVPASFPSNVCGRQKLLFFIDNLHRITYRGRTSEFAPGSENPSFPLKVPFQDRLLKFVQYFEDECDSDQIRIIAITRNETLSDSPDRPSSWEKLEINKFPQLWRSFHQYELPEPEEQSIVQLLDELVPLMGIQSRREEHSLIAQRNDNTFNNVINNIQSIMGREKSLSADTFLETQNRTWYGRYRRIVKQYPLAKYIYDAVELLQVANIALESFTVIPTSLMLSKTTGLARWFRRRKMHSVLNMLIQSENILEPRDGQIEARKRQVFIDDHMIKLLDLTLRLSEKYPTKMSSSLFSFANALDDLGHKTEAIVAYKKLTSEIKPNFHEAWHNLGVALFSIEKYKEAIDSYQKAVELKPDKYKSWDALGIAHGRQEEYKKAVEAYGNAIRITPDDWQTLYNRGNAFYHLNQDDFAIADWQKAGELNPELSQAFYNQACVYARKNNVKKTLENLEKAIKINPERYKKLAKNDVNKYFSGIELNLRFRALLALG